MNFQVQNPFYSSGRNNFPNFDGCWESSPSRQRRQDSEHVAQEEEVAPYGHMAVSRVVPDDRESNSSTVFRERRTFSSSFFSPSTPEWAAMDGVPGERNSARGLHRERPSSTMACTRSTASSSQQYPQESNASPLAPSSFSLWNGAGGAVPSLSWIRHATRELEARAHQSAVDNRVRRSFFSAPYSPPMLDLGEDVPFAYRRSI